MEVAVGGDESAVEGALRTEGWDVVRRLAELAFAEGAEGGGQGLEGCGAEFDVGDGVLVAAAGEGGEESEAHVSLECWWQDCVLGVVA